MKKNENKYAEPIQVSDIKRSCNPNQNYAGYDVEVIFNTRTNIPHPHLMDPEQIHCYTDPNGTVKVVYSFPFIGYGIINWGKLAAQNWANKMRNKIDPKNLEPLYELHDNKTMEFICGKTGRNCAIATQYFQQLKKIIDNLSKGEKTQIVQIQGTHCCINENCPVWKKYVDDLKERIK